MAGSARHLLRTHFVREINHVRQDFGMRLVGGGVGDPRFGSHWRGFRLPRGDEIDLTTTGSGSVTIPPGYEWTDVSVQCWGGGGGGGGGGDLNGAGGGGGGGAYAYNTYPTLAFGLYDYYVGAGGGGASGNGSGDAGETQLGITAAFKSLM